MTQIEWLKGALTALVAQPLRYATETSLELESHSDGEAVPSNLTVWTGSIRSMKCRRLAMPEPNQGLAVMDQDYPVVQSNEDGTSEQVIDLKPLITQLALDGRNTVQVRERIRDIPGSEDITDRSLTALIASARARANRHGAT